MTGELKPLPCPFCGSPAKLEPIRDGKQVQCCSPRCFARGPAVFHGPNGWAACEQAAITAWNTRPREEALEAEVGRLREALKAAAEAVTMITTFEDDSRYIMGNTNFSIVQMRKAQILAALSHPKGADE